LRVYGYGAMVALGGILSFWLLRSRLAKAGLKCSEDFWLFVNILLLSGPLSGRILYLFEYTKPFSPEFWEAMLSPSRGFSMLGAFFGVPLALWGFCRWKSIPFARFLDGVLVLAPVWHAFGRLGCFLSGCCHGRPTDLPWGVVFRDPMSGVPARWLGVPLHPTQLLEVAGDILITALLYRLSEREGQPGLVTAAYFASYGALRFFIEFLRGDTVPLFLGLTAGQGLGLVLIAAAGVILVWRSRCSRPC
jgi:phosphatidylglycerol:prolipoprotein diacylglycerol transferase